MNFDVLVYAKLPTRVHIFLAGWTYGMFGFTNGKKKEVLLDSELEIRVS